MDEMLRDHAVMVHPSEPGTQHPGQSLQARVSDLESEVTKLKEQLGKAKSINDTMWETVVQKVVVGSTASPGDAMDVEGDFIGVGGQKRARTRK